jgi:hypothetical protein
LNTVEEVSSSVAVVRKSRWGRVALAAAFFIAGALVLDRVLGHLLLTGLHKYYGLNEPCEVLFIGHSHTVLGVDKVALEKSLGINVAKFAVEGASAADRLVMLRYFLSQQRNTVKVVVYDVDAHTFTGEGLSSNSYQLLFPFMDQPDVSAFVRRHCGSFHEFIVRKWFRTPRFNELTLNAAVRGHLGRWDNLKRGVIDVATLQRRIDMGRFRRIQLDDTRARLFDEAAQVARENGALFVMAYIPTIDVFNRAEPEKFAEMMRRFQSWAERDAGILFWDYNRDMESRHELFFDEVHLNPAGRRVLSERLSADLKRVLAPDGTNRSRPATAHLSPNASSGAALNSGKK